MTTREDFTNYLSQVIINNRKYASSTVYTYGQSIELISTDIKNYLKENIKSLFYITDIEILNNYFERLYSIPEIKKEEEIQRKRKTNAFKRYIEFCETLEQNNFDINQPELDDLSESKTEGGKKIIISKIAERDSQLRLLAIKIHGTTCFGCNFDFKEKYGKLGEGFIEIHHITLLSSYNEKKTTNPKTDLIPLCSNCHRMVHRKKNYVLSLSELKKVINNRH